MNMKFSTGKRSSKNKGKENLYLLIYFLLSIIYLESLLRISTLGLTFSPTILFSIIFALFFASLFYMLVGLFPAKINYILTILVLFFLTSLFVSQLVYYKIFKTFYTVYSASNAGQVLQFWKEVLLTMKSNIILLILLFLPFLIFLFIGKKLLRRERLKLQHLAFLFLGLVFLQVVAILGLRLGKNEANSPYNLYYNIHYPNYSVKKLGLLTYMRLDVQRNISKWSPKLIGELPEPSPEPSPPQDKDKDKGEGVQDEEALEYNIMDIDFDRLVKEEKNKDILEMHKYFSSLSPTEKNEYTGRFKDYNLILITAEAFSHLAVDKNLTPTLYKMVHEGFHFKNFYTPIWGVSTSDGEYVANTSLLPKSGVWSFRESSKIYMPFVMGNQLKKLGYTTKAYHNHTYTFYDRHLSHPNMGYDYQGLGNGLEVKETWPESDLEMMELTIDKYINNQPFHINYMTVSGHMLYTFNGNYIANKNRNLVKDLDYSSNARAYLATQIELDKALEYLLKKLEDAGLADKTLIALSADHYPYGLEVSEMEELAGKSIEENFELYRNAFILYSPDMEPEVIDKPVSSLDIIPTLSNLLGLEYDSRLLMGVDVFSSVDPIIIFENRSFISKEGSYNSKTQKFTPNPGFDKDEELRKKISSIINGKFYYSARILETDYYSKILNQ